MSQSPTAVLPLKAVERPLVRITRMCIRATAHVLQYTSQHPIARPLTLSLECRPSRSKGMKEREKEWQKERRGRGAQVSQEITDPRLGPPMQAPGKPQAQTAHACQLTPRPGPSPPPQAHGRRTAAALQFTSPPSRLPVWKLDGRRCCTAEKCCPPAFIKCKLQPALLKTGLMRCF